MKTPIIRATAKAISPDTTERHYTIQGQALDSECKLINCGFSTFSVVRFETELSYIRDNFDCQIVREFKA